MLLSIRVFPNVKHFSLWHSQAYQLHKPIKMAKPTHGVKHTNIDSEGVKRVFSLGLYDDNVYNLIIQTITPGFEDLITEINFTKYSIDLLSQFLPAALEQINDNPLNNDK